MHLDNNMSKRMKITCKMMECNRIICSVCTSQKIKGKRSLAPFWKIFRQQNRGFTG